MNKAGRLEQIRPISVFISTAFLDMRLWAGKRP
jgi:hypothetical protein